MGQGAHILWLATGGSASTRIVTAIRGILTPLLGNFKWGDLERGGLCFIWNYTNNGFAVE